MSSERILVPVSETSTLRETVGYAVKEAVEDATPSEPALVRFVWICSPQTETVTDEQLEAGEDLLSRASVWATEDAGDHEAELTVETAVLGKSEYVFSPADVAALLEDEIAANGIDRIVLDPEYDPGIGAPLLLPLEVELAQRTNAAVEEAPVERAARRVPLIRRDETALGTGALFGTAFVFYQVLAGAFSLFDLVTGTVSATIVAVALTRVAVNRRPDRGMPARFLRGLVYVPYLLYEIIAANLVVSAAILDPRLPIDPRMTRIKADVVGPLPTTTLANSITLTPGTLTVRVRGQRLVVHTLLPWAKEGLFDGSLERAVRFVFYGRDSMAIPSPRERGDTEVLQPPADDGDGNGEASGDDKLDTPDEGGNAAPSEDDEQGGAE